MCGIAGFIGKGSIHAMLETLTHRGPDQVGHWEGDGVALGCRRLAIIDVAGGKQPIFNEDGKSLIVFNGEIFNYPELRNELKRKHRFTTQTDTEVILHAFEEWGPKCLDRFNGMFAIAVWDGEKLFLARDRIGEKPLYYHHGPSGFFFASEIKAILTQIEGKVSPTPEFIAFEYPAGADTYYENIKSLEPGCCLEFNGQRTVVKRYWSIFCKEEREAAHKARSDADYVEELRGLLKDSVSIRLRSDVPVGIFLSGGLDSALIGALAGPMQAFSCRFFDDESFDEWKYTELAANNIGIVPTVVTPTPDDFKREYARILWYLDGPISTLSSIGEFSLARAAQGKVKVALGGQGADELFGGYIRYLLMLEESRIINSAQMAQYIPLARKFWGGDFGAAPALRYFQLMNRAENPPQEARKTIERLFEFPGGLLDKMSFTDAHIQLPALLTMNDRAVAAYGIENRCPFLDHRIVEFAFALPEDLRIRGLRTKWILREAARGLIPDAIVDRADKKGLVTPAAKWIRGPLLGWVNNIMGGEMNNYPAGALGIFDRKLYHALSMKIWEQVRISATPPADPG